MKMGKIFFWAVLMSLFCVRVLPAATIYVNPGPGTPLQDAIDAANNGDVLVLAAGTFTEHVFINSFTGLTIQGAGMESTHIDGSGSPGTVVTISFSEKVTVKNLVVSSGTENNIYASNSKQLKFQSIGSGWAGINALELYATVGSIIQDSEFAYTGSNGVYLSEANYEFKIDNNQIVGCAEDGLKIDSAKHGVVQSNSFESNGSDGMELNAVNDVKITDNTAGGNGQIGFKINTSANYDVVVKGNVAVDNPFGGFYGYEGVLFMNNISGLNSSGITCYSACIIKNNTVMRNSIGIIAMYGSGAINNLAQWNEDTGIVAGGYGALIQKNKMLENGGDGLGNSFDMVILVSNFADSNLGLGFLPQMNAVLAKKNRSTNNGFSGFSDMTGQGCTTSSNLAMNNTEAGFITGSNDVYFRNRSISNGGDGIFVSGMYNSITRNVILNNVHNGIHAGNGPSRNNFIKANTSKYNGNGATWFDLFDLAVTDDFWLNNKFGTSNF